MLWAPQKHTRPFKSSVDFEGNHMPKMFSKTAYYKFLHYTLY